MNKDLTIHDIAEALRVSGATVSMALRNDPRVAEKTRLRIREYAEDRGFRPNPNARNFRLKRSFNIAIVVANIASNFWREVIPAAEKEFGLEYRICVYNTHGDPLLEKQILELLMNQQADGVILQPATTQTDHLAPLRKAGIPVVLFERHDDPNVSFVKCDDYSTASAALRYCFELGHQAVGCLYFETSILGIQDRLDGFLTTAAKLGIAEQCGVMMAQDTSEAATIAALGEKFRRYSAILALDDRPAAWMIRHLAQNGVQIPQQLSLLSWNTNAFLQYLSPAVSEIEVPIGEMTRLAARHILTFRQGNTEPLRVLLPGKIIARESMKQIQPL